MAYKKKRTAEEIRATAYHEAGHAVVAIAQGLTINKVSIIPGEEFNGVTFLPSLLHYERGSK
jgi:ATP-dependent Zn protease